MSVSPSDRSTPQPLTVLGGEIGAPERRDRHSCDVSPRARHPTEWDHKERFYLISELCQPAKPLDSYIARGNSFVCSEQQESILYFNFNFIGVPDTRIEPSVCSVSSNEGVQYAGGVPSSSLRWTSFTFLWNSRNSLACAAVIFARGKVYPANGNWSTVILQMFELPRDGLWR